MMSNFLRINAAPVIVFVYNRPVHIRRTIEALLQNELAKQCELVVFSDGPKSIEDSKGVQEVRKYLKTISGFSNIIIKEREENLGLAISIINGVTEVLATHRKVIVLEDDMVTSPYFLRYMNEALELYENEEKVISIHGYMYPVAARLPETFFLKGADCWGWGTWKRGWDLFEPDGNKLLKDLKTRELEQRFDFYGAYDYIRMLKQQIKGNNDSWAVRWYASALLKDKLTLYPGLSLVQNIGTDNSGIHCGNTDDYRTGVTLNPIVVEWQSPEEDKNALTLFQDYFVSIRPPLYKRLLHKLRRIAGC